MAGPAAGSFLQGVIVNLIAELAGQGVNKLLLNPAQGALGPSNYQSADPMGQSRYFTSPAQALAFEQYIATEYPKRALLKLIPGIGQYIPDLPNREDIIGGFEDGKFVGQAALTEAQARSLTEREIQKIRAEKEFELQARLAEAQAGIQREKIKALSELQGKVEGQKVQSLGEVQSQRLQSQYGAASDILNEAIKNIAFRDKLEIGNTLTELARAV